MQAEIHYKILELEPGASQDDVKQAYKDLARVWHPDRFADDARLQRKAEEKIKLINEAYQFLKGYQPQGNRIKIDRKKNTVETSLKCKKLKDYLELESLKEADFETKRLLLELAGREKQGWLQPDDAINLPSEELVAIDQLWLQYTDGKFGFSKQKEIWLREGCKSANDMQIRTVNENKFGKAVRWRTESGWLAPWDTFNYSKYLVEGSLPREYIFSLSGWWSYSKGWSGYLLLRFDEIFLKV